MKLFFRSSRLSRRRPGRRGFTLVEMLIATSVMAIVSVGMLRVFVQALNVYSYDTGKLLVNKDIRKFTAEMTENATYSNYFRIFPSHTNLTRTVDTYIVPTDPDEGYVQAIADTTVNTGESGDCLVLVYKNKDDDRNIEQLLIYFRVPGPNDAAGNPTPGPVRFAKVPVDPLSGGLPIWQLIPSPPSKLVGMSSVVVELSNGLADGKLFYNFFDKSIIVKGAILHRGGMVNTRNATATNTYNFTVSPRG